MAKKSTVIGLPIVPYNQNKHSDVVQYLEYIEDFLMKVYTPDDAPPVPPEEESARRERVLKNVNVPLCGDLLGRERVTGAKKTRMGCDLHTERFDNITENATLWHAKQSFLGVSCSKMSYIVSSRKSLESCVIVSNL